MTYNQLDENVNTPDINNKIDDRFSSETLLKLFINDSLNRKKKEKEKKDNQ